MNTEKIPNHCPKCGAPLPADAPQGLCAKCLLAVAATPTEAGQPHGERWTPPPLGAIAVAFPNIELLQLIGAGGMGAVYKARQPKLDRFVALKILPQALAKDAGFAERFSREARLLARLNHPGIVSVYDYGETGGFFYLLMEFVDGVNLRQAMRAGRFSPQQALFVVPKICEALQFAHDEGILHRDIKPENILLDTRGRVKIADFGIAKLIGDKIKGATLTASGMVVGTPHYMAPEQLEHPQDVDQRADIYSLGVVFYEMLTGELPLGRFAPPSQKTPVDPRVDAVVLQSLEKERERRQHNAAEVKTEIEQITATSAVPVGIGSADRTAQPPSAAPKTSKCYISTLEHLRTLRGQLLHIYQGAGTLRLDSRTLNFSSGWQVVNIPLGSISALAVGDYPASAKPSPLSYLSVKFTEYGVSRTLLFTPVQNRLAAVREINKVVEEWTSALRQAIQNATGRALPIDRSRLVQNWPWGELVKTYLLTAAAVTGVFVLVPLILQQRLPRWPVDWIQGPIVAAAVLGGLLISRWKRRRRAEAEGNLDALVSRKTARTSAEPEPFTPPQSGSSDSAGTEGSSGGTSPSDSVVADQLTTPGKHPDRRAACYFSTPGGMRKAFPGPWAQVFQCRGDLHLESGNLTFTSPWRTRVVIPLIEICDLSIGQFRMWKGPWALSWFPMLLGPGAMNYEPLSFLSVTFGAGDWQRTVHFTPVLNNSAPVSLINKHVAAWFDAIRNAVLAVTGVPPHVAEPGKVSIGSRRVWNPKAVLLFAPLIAWLVAIKNIWPVDGPASATAWASAFALSLLLCLAIAWYFLGFFKAHQALRSGNLDAVTGNEDPAEAGPSVLPRAESDTSKRKRPFWWTASAWVFIAIGLLAVIDSLAGLYERPVHPSFYPGLAHLFAGIALLTLSRRWRIIALVALSLAVLAGAFVGVMMAISPEHGLVSFPALNLTIPASEKPSLAAAPAVFLALVLFWPCYLLLSAKAKALFGLAKPK